MRIRILIALLLMLFLILGLNSSAQINECVLPCPLPIVLNAFLKIDGIQGESTDENHQGWIDLYSFSHGMGQVVLPSLGIGTGKVSHQDFNVVKSVDASSPLLYLAVNTGQHFKEGKLELVRAGGDKQKYMEVKMSDIIVTSVQYSGNQNTQPTESVSFSYGKIEWIYTPSNKEDVKTGWDVKSHKKA